MKVSIKGDDSIKDGFYQVVSVARFITPDNLPHDVITFWLGEDRPEFATITTDSRFYNGLYNQFEVRP